ncbi:unnamed protein product, partial [Bubo scandiacus]
SVHAFFPALGASEFAPLGCIVPLLDEVRIPWSLMTALLSTSGGGEFCAGALQSPHPAGIMHYLLRAHTGAHLTFQQVLCLLTVQGPGSESGQYELRHSGTT